MEVVLGSSSRWRRDLARQSLGSDVELLPPGIDERAIARTITNANPTSHCSVIARAKLDFLLQKVTVPSIILCFDTIVVHAGVILEKPIDEVEALAMVRAWGRKGEEISVFTAVACALTSPSKIVESVESARIHATRDLTDDEIAKYFEEKSCLESSGAVIVENHLEYRAATIEGEQSMIEGFPITAVKKIVHAFKKI
jgi:septum formation protein